MNVLLRVFGLLLLASSSLVYGDHVKKIGFVIQKDEVFSNEWDRFEKPDDYELCLLTSSNPNGILASGTIFDQVILVPDLCFNQVEEECRRFAKEKNVPLEDCYFTTHDEYALELCAYFSEKYATYGNSLEAIAPFRNKIIAKEKLKNSGVPLPKHFHYEPEKLGECAGSLLREKISEIGFPAFIKPVNEARCKDVHKIDSLGELELWLKDHTVGDYEVDEFLDGELYTAMSILQNGEISIFGVHKFLYPCFEFMNQKRPLGGHNLCEGQEDVKELKRLSQLLFSKMPLKDGVVHIEFMKRREKDEFVFIEAAARQPGGYISDVFEKAKGMNLGAVHYALQMQIPIRLQEKTQYHAAWFWPNKPVGTVQCLLAPLLSSQYKVFWRVREGDVLAGSKFLGDSSYRLLIWNKDFKDLLQDLDSLENEQDLTPIQ